MVHHALLRVLGTQLRPSTSFAVRRLLDANRCLACVATPFFERHANPSYKVTPDWCHGTPATVGLQKSCRDTSEHMYLCEDGPAGGGCVCPTGSTMSVLIADIIDRWEKHDSPPEGTCAAQRIRDQSAGDSSSTSCARPSGFRPQTAKRAKDMRTQTVARGAAGLPLGFTYRR